MVKVMCIEKVRDEKSNNIIKYGLQRDNSSVTYVNPELLKEEIRKGNIEVVNLTLTSDNRLIDSFKKKGLVSHTPCKKLTDEQRQYIVQHGLVHFFSDEYEEATRKNGLLTEWDKPLLKKESGMIWFFINDKQGNEIGLKEYLTKKSDHRASDINHVCKSIYKPTFNETENFLLRPEGRGLAAKFTAPAIVVRHSIPANKLEISKVKQ